VRCVRPIAGDVTVLTVEAILNFALTGSARGLDLHVVGPCHQDSIAQGDEPGTPDQHRTD
jgi:hypothetical protein